MVLLWARIKSAAVLALPASARRTERRAMAKVAKATGAKVATAKKWVSGNGGLWVRGLSFCFCWGLFACFSPRDLQHQIRLENRGGAPNFCRSPSLGTPFRDRCLFLV